MIKGRTTLGSRKRRLRDYVSSWNYTRRGVAGSGSGPANIPRVVLTIICIQFVWWIYDQSITSQTKHKAPRKYVQPTASSPLSPFYNNDNNDPYTGPARAFPIWPHPFPCGPLIPESELNARNPTNEGFLFIKEMKSGSTTLSGITARIARNMANKRLNTPEDTDIANNNKQSNTNNANATVCTARLVHMRARRLRERVRDKSFLWSVVREPVARLVSKFFHFAVSRDGTPATLPNLIKYVQDNEVTDYGYYFKSMSLRARLNPYRTDLYDVFTKELLDAYDFLGVSDRMDESLAVLQLLLGLDTSDMLHLSTKTSGSYEQFNHKCVLIQPYHVAQDMKEWFYSTEFESFVEPDVMVYQAVNTSLELTIEQLGRTRVDQTVKRLKWAQRLVQEKCEKVTKFPCSSEGVIQEPNDCLLSDVACGYQCLDQVGNELSTHAEFQKLLLAA